MPFDFSCRNLWMSTYSPSLQSENQANDNSCPSIFQSPGRYIQKQGILEDLASYLTYLNAKCAAILVSSSAEQRFGDAITKSFSKHGISTTFYKFVGESSWEEIERLVQEIKLHGGDIIVSVGGGKTIDTGKGVAYLLKKPSVVVPTIASNDAPCSALSIIYTPKGEFVKVFFFPENPAAVIVDTKLVAEAPVRYLVAG